MTNTNKESYIDGIDELKETVRKIVSERVYGMIKESMYEQYFENDEKKDDSEENEKENDTIAKNSSPEKKSDNKEIAKERNQVTTMLRDPKINMAELGRDLYPEMSDDAARSLISKKSRGVRELTPEEVITLYQKLRGTRVSS